MTLKDIKKGQSVIIKSVGASGALRQHFLDMGLIPGAEATLVKYAPMGDPIEIQIHGYELALRLSEASQIEVELIDERSNAHKRITRIEPSDHPGLGEDGKYHSKDHANPLPEGTEIDFALVGNQNCGKTTLFNQLTGSSQHVGNFPGVTVEGKEGMIKNIENTKVTDLPGIYSMSPYSNEEIVSRNFVLKNKPKGIINIVDATNIERNLYLSMQLLEMDIPMVVAVNMMDELNGNGGSIDINGMEAMLGVPVIPITAAKNEGVKELIDHAIHVAKYQERPVIQDFCSKEDHGGAIHRAIHAVSAVIEDHAEKAQLPLRFASTKVIEGDKLVLDALKLDSNELEMIEHIVLQMENEGRMDRAAAIADMRFDYIEKVCEKTVQKPVESKEKIRSEKIDSILTGKWTALPLFIIIMGLVFYLTFDVIGGNLQILLDEAISKLSDVVNVTMTNLGVSLAIKSLVTDGIFAGVGAVVSFLPIIVTLFFFLSIMEDTGYIARVAFFMDKLLRRVGLSGRSIVPLLIGFGCTVPAVMSTRTLPSKRDRKLTILLTPFMSCSAKVPVYAFFVQIFFPEHRGLIMISLYLIGIILGILVALLFKNTLFKGEAVPFVMELPNYRMPGVKNVLLLLWDKAKDFITKAFTVIFIASIVVWFLQSFSFNLRMVSDSSMSMIASIAGLLSPLFSVIGLGDWRIITSLICGVMAKESVVSTLEILFAGNVGNVLSAAGAGALLIFSLLYTPCVAAINAIKKELGFKYAIAVVVWQCFIAWCMAGLTYMIMK